ncbi:MAG: LCP family protein, partial [Acidimicrobiia bacterium]|nr:LCP family protein [Acidimicrobiia bacterium]
MAGASDGRRLRRTWPQRLLIGVSLVLITSCLLGASGLVYLYQRFGDLPRIEFEEGVLEAQPEQPGEPQNFLLVGSDDRADLEDPERFGTKEETGEAKSDTIMVVRVDPAAKTAAMLSFPRDLWVDVAGTGRRARINTAFDPGGEEGARRLIETIKLNFDIPVHHYAQVDFEGFRRVVDAVGGIKLYLPHPVRDRGCDENGCRNFSGLDISETGCLELDGDQSLSYVRSRNFEELIEGDWEADLRSDLGRIDRQQDFIRRALRKALTEDLLNPLRLNALVGVAIDTVVVDEGLGVDDIVELGERFRSFSSTALQQATLADVVERVIQPGGEDTLEIVDTTAAETIFSVFRDPEAAAGGELAPSAVSVKVVNGSVRAGEAGRTSA